MWAYLSVIIMYASLVLLSVIAPFLAILAFFYWAPPLMFRAMNPNDTFVRNHAANMVNATLTSLIAGVVLLIGIGLCFTILRPVGILFIIGWVAYFVSLFVCEVKGAIRASNGRTYVFPYWLTIRFVKQEASDVH
jgi:uncharacterized Tic20 family protein